MSQSFTIKTKDGQAYEVDAQGSLGLLALGYLGLKIWREKRAQVKPDTEDAQT